MLQVSLIFASKPVELKSGAPCGGSSVENSKNRRGKKFGQNTLAYFVGDKEDKKFIRLMT